MKILLVKPLIVDGKKREIFTDIGVASFRYEHELKLELDLFPILVPGAYLKLSLEENEGIAIEKKDGMERRKIILEETYKFNNEEKIIKRIAGFAFLNIENKRIISINMYIDILPFGKIVEFKLEEVSDV